MSGEHTDYDDHTVVGCPRCGATHTKGFMLCGTLFEPPELDFRGFYAPSLRFSCSRL